MILRTLTSRNFRNLDTVAIDFHPSTNILIGRNGQGKTNLLEAIYFLATTKSFRTSRIASLFRFHEANVFVTGALERQNLARTLSVGLESAETKRRVLMINGEKVTLPAYLNAMTVFAYSSARLDILRGAPEERRRFLDRGIASLHPTYLEQLTRYGRVLKQRNALLHDVATNRQVAASLQAWDDELHAAATIVHRARAVYAAELAHAFRAIVVQHGYHVANVELSYRPSLTEALGQLRRDELRARMSLVGPQRDLLEFVVDGMPASEVLSGGEQKMIVLFLKFAKLELFRRRHDESAVFLLDDVDAELDLPILHSLLTKLPVSTQLFTTSAKEVVLEVLEAGPHRRLTIEKGRVIGARDFE